MNDLVRRAVRKLERTLESSYAALDVPLRTAAARSPMLSRLYYATWSRAFRREQHAFLAGRARYDHDLQQPSASLALLRRNVHRIEKGLLMRPRRAVFAKDYIGETVAAYERAATASALFDTDELRWAHDVLSMYFSVTAEHEVLDRARAQFEAVRRAEPVPEAVPAGDGHATISAAAEFVPYRREDVALPSYDSLWQLARHRRSVRWFRPDPVPRALIDRALELGTQAPSACNRQPFRFCVFDDPDLVQRVARIPMGTAGYAHNIPVFCVVVGQQRNYFDERDRHLIYIDASLAVMGVLFALETQGLSSCCINWPDMEEKEREMADFLHLAPDERPVMSLAIGYPDPEGMVAYSQKKPIPLIRTYNFE